MTDEAKNPDPSVTEGQNPTSEATTGAQAPGGFGTTKSTSAPEVAPAAAVAAVDDTSETVKQRAARYADGSRSLRSDSGYMPVAPGADAPAEDYAEIGNWRGLPLFGCQWPIVGGNGGRCPYSTTEEGDIQSHVRQTHYVRRPSAPLIFGPNGSPIDSGSGRAQS